jgi:hypothetical protein
MTAMITEWSGPNGVLLLVTVAVLIRRFMPVTLVVTIDEDTAPPCFGFVRQPARRFSLSAALSRLIAVRSPLP